MFMDLAATIELQEPQIVAAEEQTTQTVKHTEEGNKHLDKGIKSAKNRRKLKWWCFGIVVLIIVILGAVLGGYFGYQAAHNKNNNSGTKRRRELGSLPVRDLPVEEQLLRRVVEEVFTA